MNRNDVSEAIKPTTAEAIEYLKSMVFPQDFSPSTLRAVAINKLAIFALEKQMGKPPTGENTDRCCASCGSYVLSVMSFCGFCGQKILREVSE